MKTNLRKGISNMASDKKIFAQSNTICAGLLNHFYQQRDVCNTMYEIKADNNASQACAHRGWAMTDKPVNTGGVHGM